MKITITNRNEQHKCANVRDGEYKHRREATLRKKLRALFDNIRVLSRQKKQWIRRVFIYIIYQFIISAL